MTDLEPEPDTCTTTVTSWVTPGCEKNLRRAAEISNDAGYHYLSDEHIVLAMLENPRSYLSRNLLDGVAYTREQLHEVMRECLPPLPLPGYGPTQPVRVVTEWVGPHADEVRAQIAAEGSNRR